MKWTKLIKSSNEMKDSQLKFINWLKKYSKVLKELEAITYDIDDANDGGFNTMFFDLVEKVTNSNEVPNFLPHQSFDEVAYYCDDFIKKAESILNKTSTKNTKKN